METKYNQGNNMEILEQGLNVARLNLGIGEIGRDTALSQNEEQHFAQFLSSYNFEPNYNGNEADKFVTGMCMDDREYVSFANGQSDPNFFNKMSTYEVAGGIGLSATKALVASQAKLVEGIDNMWDAYIHVSKFLRTVDILDAGHEDCGASNKVKDSVEGSLQVHEVVENVGGLIRIDDHAKNELEVIRRNKLGLANSRFYDTWSPKLHQEYLINNHASRFAKLNTPEGAPLNGHKGAGVLIRKHGGHPKNLVSEVTGKDFFSISDELLRKVSERTGVTQSESKRIYLALYDDIANVGNQLFYTGMPVLTDMDPSIQPAA